MTSTYLNYFWIALAIVLVAGLLLWLGWRNRKRRQAHVPAPEEIPVEILDDEPLAAGEGMVIGTVKEIDILDRVAVHGLGIRTDGRVEVHPEGAAIFRSGAPNFLITRQQMTQVSTDRGVLGKFVEKDGALILGWTLGQERVLTAFRARHASAHQQLLEQLQSLTGSGSADAGPASGTTPASGTASAYAEDTASDHDSVPGTDPGPDTDDPRPTHNEESNT